MKISHDIKDDIAIITIKGEIEKENEETMREYIENLYYQGKITKLVIDASEIKYLGSSTLGVLSTLYQKITSTGGRLIFASLSTFVKKIFKITTFEKFFIIKHSVTDAIDELTRH